MDKSLLLFLVFSLSSFADFIPLHQSSREAPLAYQRLPLVWQVGDLFNGKQQEKILKSIFQIWTPNKAWAFALRSLIYKSDGPLELLVLPPKNQMLPIPSFVIKGGHRGQQNEVAEYLQQLIKKTLESIQGANVDWLKFKRRQENGLLIDQAFLLGHMTIVVSKKTFYFYFSQKNKDLYKDFTNKNKENIERGLETTKDDLLLFLDLNLLQKFYEPFLKNFSPALYRQFGTYGMFDMERLFGYTSGRKQDFSLHLSANWKSKTKSIWPAIKATKNNSQVFLPRNSDFSGAFKFPSLSQSSFLGILELIAPKEKVKSPAYHRFYQSLGHSVSFTWSERSMSPIFMLSLKDVKKFEREFSNIFRPYVNISKEIAKGVNVTHLRWGENTISYMIKDSKLYFSPLLHGLRDYQSKEQVVRKQGNLFEMTYPLEGRVRDSYYTMLHFILQAHVLSKKGVNPNDFPAFSLLPIQDGKWQGLGKIKLQNDKEKFYLKIEQPYGLPGLLSGIKMKSAGYMYFISLLSLTANSF